MAVADTARLISSLELQDKFTGTAEAAQQSLTGLEQKSSLVSRGFGLIGQAAGGIGGAFSTLKGRIGQLISGPLGLIGLSGGIFGLFEFIKGTVTDVGDFAKEVGRLSSVTGLTTEATSRLAGAFHHFGLETDDVLRIAGFTEKTLFSLGGTVEKAKGFYDKYGLSLRDANGKLKDFNTLLLDSADFFNNKSIPSQTKAAALSAIYGRGWQTLIPILSAGRKGISDAEEEAEALGLTLTKDNLVSLGKLKDATRDWGTALGGLKLQIGLAVVPILTDLTKGATDFLKSTDEFGRTGSQRIVGFFQGLIDFGKKAFGVIQTQVVPLVKQVIDGWDRLPEPLKNLLVKGAAGNFAIKFLLGFDPVGLATQVAGAIAGKLAVAAGGAVAGAFGNFIGDFFGRTAAQKLIPQAVEILPGVTPIPVFVTNPGFGFGGGPTGPLDTATKVGFWATILKFLPVAGTILGLTTIPTGEAGGEEQVGLVSQAAHKFGATIDDVLATGATLGAIKEFADNPDLRVGVDPKLLTAIDALTAALKPAPGLIPGAPGGRSAPHEFVGLIPGAPGGRTQQPPVLANPERWAEVMGGIKTFTEGQTQEIGRIKTMHTDIAAHLTNLEKHTTESKLAIIQADADARGRSNAALATAARAAAAGERTATESANIARYTGIDAAKPPPSFAVTIPVTAVANINVNGFLRTVTSAWIASASGGAGPALDPTKLY